MSRTQRGPSTLNRRSRILNIILILALLLPFAVSVRTPVAMAKVHSSLMQMAVEHPDETVDVIIQMASLNWGVGNMVAHLGGRVTKDLHLIKGFAAELPARAIPGLACVAGVRAVSPDAPMVSTSTATETLYPSQDT